jgi:hypothetical protein
LVGFERERLLWAAGIRTHMLVCVMHEGMLRPVIGVQNFC